VVKPMDEPVYEPGDYAHEVAEALGGDVTPENLAAELADLADYVENHPDMIHPAELADQLRKICCRVREREDEVFAELLGDLQSKRGLVYDTLSDLINGSNIVYDMANGIAEEYLQGYIELSAPYDEEMNGEEILDENGICIHCGLAWAAKKATSDEILEMRLSVVRLEQELREANLAIAELGIVARGALNERAKKVVGEEG
jgi:hypothetical protein